MQKTTHERTMETYFRDLIKVGRSIARSLESIDRKMNRANNSNDDIDIDINIDVPDLDEEV